MRWLYLVTAVLSALSATLQMAVGNYVAGGIWIATTGFWVAGTIMQWRAHRIRQRTARLLADGDGAS